MTRETLTAKVAELEGLMTDRLRVRGGDLGAQVRKAGRLLPRRISRDARFLAEAVAMQQSPKLARMVDEARVAEAHASVRDFLKSVDPVERRKDRILGILGGLAFAFLVIAGAIIWVLRWRGYV